MMKNTKFQIIAGAVIFVAMTWGLISILSRHDQDYSSTTVSRKDLTEIVNANGNVISDQNVTLAFNMQGRVSDIFADVGSTTVKGQILATLDTGTLQASLDGTVADVEAAQARLSQLQRGARPEEMALYSQKYSDASLSLVSAMKSAELAIEDAITGKTDVLFVNGNTVNPTINIRTQSTNEKISIEQERLKIYDSLQNLRVQLSAMNQQASGSAIATSTLDAARIATHSELLEAKAFLDHLGMIASNLTSGNTGLSQTTIDGYRAVVNGASQEVTSALSSEQTIDAAWSSARDSLTLEQAGSASEDIQVAEATLDKANAAVSGLQSQIRQSKIISPFDGVITSMDLKIGEVYVPGVSAAEGISLMSRDQYKVEVYVPETDIGKVAEGEKASITLDAYGPSTIFDGHITLVNPAQTVVNGISAYKVTIGFDDQSDSRIKSGLTANVTIMTKVESGALSIPERAVITRGNDKFVLVKKAGSGAFVEQTVKTGIASSDGFVEILSGLSEGDVVAGFGAGSN